ADWVLHHHERWDGDGYPDRLRGEEIPLGARIIFVADAYDAMTSERVYERSLSPSEALEELERCSGSQFDPAIVDACSEELTVRAIAEQATRGITLMLPSEDALVVSRELARRFGLPRWQFALTATDANRFAIRLARHVTERPKLLVFNWCYHGTVDETFATLDDAGRVVERDANIGPPVPLAETTRVVEWN